jgi:hypothetical protein
VAGIKTIKGKTSRGGDWRDGEGLGPIYFVDHWTFVTFWGPRARGGVHLQG